MIYRDTPTAWLQLRAQKPQTAAAIASIAFITILLFIQLGFRASFLDSMLQMPARLRGDLFLVSIASETILYPIQFSQQYLYQMLAFPEVESVMPIYVSGAAIPNPNGKEFLSRFRAIGIPVTTNPFMIPAVDDHFHLLKEVGVILFDEWCHEDYVTIIEGMKDGDSRKVTLRGAGLTRVTIKGVFPLFGMNEGSYGHIVTSDTTFFEVFGRQRSNIDIGIIFLKDSVNIAQVQERMKPSLPISVLIMQKHELMEREQYRFEYGSPVGVSIRIALVGACVVGIIVLYQVLFQLTSKYLRDYATMKALGFSHGILFALVLSQAGILIVIGYTTGCGLAALLYIYLTGLTGMPYTMTLDAGIIVLLLMTVICLVSAMLATRKLREADPADLFG
ncbi:MAG: hypothetical protein GY801_31315 [bacterium]|nr:hypothetical protein [bacterium]